MTDPLTPEQARAKMIADLMAQPGPKPLRPIPPDLKAEALADIESEEEWERQLAEVQRTGGEPIEPLLEELDRMVEDNR
jgi:hypothetical protein